MEDYAGRILADRYRLPLPPSDEYELIETRAFDTRSGQEVLVRQVPLPEVVDAELLDGTYTTAAERHPSAEIPAVRRAIAAAQAAASVPDHPRLDQVFDVFAEGGSLWIVSELVPARPLAALIADEPMSPYRAAEVASDVLTALRVLHAHGWTHRNITVRTVLICDDGRVVLTGLAAGAAEEALCGYDPVPPPDPDPDDPADFPFPPTGWEPSPPSAGNPAYAPLVAPGYDTGPRYTDHILPEPAAPQALEPPQAPPALPQPRPEPQPGPADLEATARAGTIAAYRTGTRAAAAKVAQERGPVVVPRLPPTGANLPQEYAFPYGGPDTAAATPWHGAAPRRPAEPAPERAPEPEPTPEPVPEPERYREPAPAPEPAALPARLALPQGYRQAEAAPDAPPPVLLDGRAGDGRSGDARDTGRGGWDAGPRDRGGWNAGGGDFGGPRTGLDAERARQTRMAVIGAVTERWAPEQAGPVHGHWQLAAPVGPATDLWALGALLYRAVQGHAPYPEESVAELVELVCAEPPAFAEECGPLRPVVESLLRQDPTERPDFEELRGWLRSLVRSAPEPDGDFAMLPMAEPDPASLPEVRRRGELHGRHRNPAAPHKPRALGRTLLVGVLALCAAAVAYAMLFMPRSGGTEEPDRQNTAAQSPAAPTPGKSAAPTPRPSGAATPSAPASQSKAAGQTDGPAPEGFTLEQDPEHFAIAVPRDWTRRGINEAGQVRYVQGAFTLTVVPGRDRVEGNPDPKGYQQDKEPELSPWRNSTWAESGDVKSTTVGGQLRVTGRYTWIDSTGRTVLARNFVVALGGTYHVVMVTGPKDEEDKVTDVFEKATASYKSGG
ncbi:serine/threonine protein kinase [Streptomyces sp. NPDC101733]|uniref:serine/threonine protein kinase n=1 Tax=unclassified Streptomyces TaxID=2593676 RepID=UPI0038103334